MADKKITDLTELTNPASGDYLEIVDVSDTTDDPAGTSKKIKKSYLNNDFYLSNFTTLKLAIDAVEAAGGGVLNLDGGTWDFYETDRELPSDIILKCTKATTIKVPDGAPHATRCITANDQTNIAIIDHAHLLTIDGNKANRTGDASEQGHNINIRGCSDVYIEVGLSTNANGDGLYVGDGSVNLYSSNIKIPFIRCDANHRNAFSIVSCENMWAGDLILSNTSQSNNRSL